MKRILLTIGIGLTALVCAPAQADPRSGGPYYGNSTYGNGLYFGVSAGELIYKEDGLDTMRPTFVEARLGQDINRYLAIEGRIGGGIGRDEVNGFSTSVQTIYAGYVKGILPLTPQFSGYGLAGVGGVQLHHNYPEFNRSDAGFSYGIGAELNVGNGASVTLEWLRVTDGTNAGFYYSADQVALGLNFHF